MIFLSASIPVKPEDIKAYPNVDVIAVREAVKALTLVLIPQTQLVWGGHPSITPLIRYIMEIMDARIQDHVTLYQSSFFEKAFPDDDKKFEKVVITPAGNSKKESLDIMRESMIKNNPYNAAVFIGGKAGVIEEYELFKKCHPDKLMLPIASTGGAASIIFERIQETSDRRLMNDKAYLALFKSLLTTVLKKTNGHL